MNSPTASSRFAVALFAFLALFCFPLRDLHADPSWSIVGKWQWLGSLKKDDKFTMKTKPSTSTKHIWEFRKDGTITIIDEVGVGKPPLTSTGKYELKGNTITLATSKRGHDKSMTGEVQFPGSGMKITYTDGVVETWQKAP